MLLLLSTIFGLLNMDTSLCVTFAGRCGRWTTRIIFLKKPIKNVFTNLERVYYAEQLRIDMSEGNVTKASASSGPGKLEGWKRGQPQIRRTNKGPWYIAAGWYVVNTTVPAAQRLRVCN